MKKVAVTLVVLTLLGLKYIHTHALPEPARASLAQNHPMPDPDGGIIDADVAKRYPRPLPPRPQPLPPRPRPLPPEDMFPRPHFPPPDWDRTLPSPRDLIPRPEPFPRRKRSSDIGCDPRTQDCRPILVARITSEDKARAFTPPHPDEPYPCPPDQCGPPPRPDKP